MKKNLYELTRFVFPENLYKEYTYLFFRKFDNCLKMEGNICKTEELRFDTWMNLFDGSKYKYYCGIDNVYINLEIIGCYSVVITGINKNDAFGKIETILVNKDCRDEECIFVPNYDKYDGIYLSLFYDVQKIPKINRICWCTDKAPVRQNVLTIISCTYKREDYITENIIKFEKFMELNPELETRIKFIISDNGQSLNEKLNSKYTTIYPNKNAGGAGGFARGMMEILDNNDNTTRILLMDDDVEVFPESFYKTLLLSDYLKEEFKDAFISGAMFDLYKKNRFIENIAVKSDFWVRGFHEIQNVNSVDDVLTLNKFDPLIFEKEYCHSAWWYHCFDISALKQGLPVPVFFRCDDIQWSWERKGKQHIFMNGINVWHAPFEWRTSKTTYYYFNNRNMFFIRCLYDKNFKYLFSEYFKNIYKNLLKTNDYVSIEILLKAMKDILRGKDIFKEDPSIVLKELSELNKKSVYKNCSDFVQYEKIKNEFKKNEIRKSKLFRKILFLLTKGLYVPKFLFKKNVFGVDYASSNIDAFLVKKMIFFNLFNNKAEIREYNSRKVKTYQKEFKKLLKQMNKNYDDIKKSFKEGLVEFKTVEFWKKYLGLK